MASRAGFFNLFFALVSLFGLSARCESQQQQLGKGAQSSGFTQVFPIWPKSSSQEWTPSSREGFPWKSCTKTGDNGTCPGFLDYLGYFCGDGSDNLTSAELEAETVVLRLLPGLHKIEEPVPRFLTCTHNLVLEGGGALNATILEAEQDSTEIQQREAALQFVNCNDIRIEGITFRSRGAGRYSHYIMSSDNRRFVVRGCVFESLGPRLGALSVFAKSAATFTSVIDCQFRIQAAKSFYPYDWSTPSVSTSLTTMPKDKDGNVTFSWMTVLRSAFVLQLQEYPCKSMRSVQRTWSM